MISGVIEGFYGRPWSEAQRLEMMDWIKAAGMQYQPSPLPAQRIAEYRRRFSRHDTARFDPAILQAAIRSCGRRRRPEIHGPRHPSSRCVLAEVRHFAIES